MSRAGGNVNFLASVGLLNKTTPDLGELALIKQPMTTFALCCSHYTKNHRLSNCPRCGYALYWRYETQRDADSDIRKYIESKWRHVCDVSDYDMESGL